MISNQQALATRPDGIDLFKLREWYRKQYLKTLWWDERRHRALELAAYRCECCDATSALHVHHLSYHHLFGEHDEDLMCVCNDCHKLAHEEEFEKKTRSMPPAEKKVAVIKHCRKKSTVVPEITFKLPNLGRRRRK